MNFLRMGAFFECVQKSVHVALFAILISSGAPSLAGQLFWTDTLTDQINRMTTGGADLTSIVTTDISGMVDVAADPIAKKIYWVDNNFDRIERSNFDGTDREVIISSGLFTPVTLDIDLAHGRLYWGDNSTFEMKRSNLDGSSIETLPHDVWGALYVDNVGGRLYWADGSIFSAPLDNILDVSLVVPHGNRKRGIAVDLVGGKVYFGTPDDIWRANLDGSDREIWIPGLVGFTDMEFDAAARHLYWTEQTGGTIRRAPVDGGPIETVYSGDPGPAGLALIGSGIDVPEPTTLTLAALALLPLGWSWRRISYS